MKSLLAVLVLVLASASAFAADPRGAKFCTSTNPTVTSASAVMIDANTARRSIIIQNRNATGNIHINFNAAATTTAHYRIAAAGGELRIDTAAPLQAIHAIGSIASNTDVTVISCQQ